MKNLFFRSLELLAVIIFALIVGLGIFYMLSKTGVYDKIINSLSSNMAKPLEQKVDIKPIIQEALPNLYILDNDVGRRLKENTKIHYKTPYFDITTTTNQDGFTGRNYNIETKNYRVAVLGDSSVEAYGVNDDDRFTQIAEDLIYEKSNKKLEVEVLGFGVSGWGQVHQYGAIKKYVLKYKPNEIYIFFLPTNDTGDNTSYLNQPPLGPTFIYDKNDKNKIIDIKFGYAGNKKSVIEKRKLRHGKQLDTVWTNWAYGLLPYFWSLEHDPLWDEIIGQTYQTFELIKKLCDENKIKLNVVYRYSTYDYEKNFKAFEIETKKFLKKDINMSRTLGYNRFRTKLESMGIRVISTSEIPLEDRMETAKDETEVSKHKMLGNFLADKIIESLNINK